MTTGWDIDDCAAFALFCPRCACRLVNGACPRTEGCRLGQLVAMEFTSKADRERQARMESLFPPEAKTCPHGKTRYCKPCGMVPGTFPAEVEKGRGE